MDVAKDNRKKVKRILIWAIVCFVLSLSGLVFYFCYKVEPTTDKMIIELGEPVSNDLNDYITGMDWAIPYSQLDLSGVVQDAVGEYEAVLTHGGQRFVYDIVIQDTTPPELFLERENQYLELGETYSMDRFVTGAEDISGSVELSLNSMTGYCGEDNTIAFFSCGTFPVGIEAVDPSGNVTRDYVDVIVDTAPEISGMQEYYIAVGSEVNYLDGIVATDTVDGDVTGTLEVNLDAFNADAVGEYIITYTAVDGYGLVAEAGTTVRVMEKMDLQEAINTHRINRFDHTIVGAYNLYDGGYYEEDNPDFIKEEMEPAFVVIKPTMNSRGSGFIIEITEEYVLLCTNQHVVKRQEDVYVYFHEGTMLGGTVVGRDSGKDIALVKVPRENIPGDLMDTLKTVHINKSYWDGLSTEKVSLVMRTLNEDGTVWRDKEGNMLNKIDDTEYDSWNRMTRMSLQSFGGCSGSAILDGYGNLITMARGHVNYYYQGAWKVSNWGVCLDDILNFYEETMGKQLYYY